MYTAIDSCRACGNSNLVEVLDLGEQALTGIFPDSRDATVPSGPLILLKCHGNDACGLLQLGHSYDAQQMYGDNYGYRSGLNASMVKHLAAKVVRIEERVALEDGDIVLDIGSNDGTTLSFYRSPGLRRIGIDPTAAKFREYYPPDVQVVADFFSAESFKSASEGGKARVVTSFSMFYDLEAPCDFARQVADALEDEGVWILEQSYMPEMMRMNSFDTVCHEHLEYYGLAQIQYILAQAGMHAINVEFNDVNGGSFSVTAAKLASSHVPDETVGSTLAEEDRLHLEDLEPYLEFAERTAAAREEIRRFLEDACQAGKSVGILGASTKGNVLLQYCGMTAADVVAVGEVNPDKFGSFTPGSLLPIVPESELLETQPDYLMVLPWHFREFFLSQFAGRGINLVFPLPRVEVVRV